MTFFNDLWKKFKQPVPNETSFSSPKKPLIQDPNAPQKNLASHQNQSTQLTSPKDDLEISQNNPSVLQNAESVLNAFEHLETESEHLYSNLNALKALVTEPKIEQPHKPSEHKNLDLRFSTIKKHLGPPEAHETVRQERWQPNIHCPDCHSGNLKRLTQTPPQSPYKHRYRCLECGLVFNDDTGTPLEQNVPPLSIWMQCWYLMGCTESLSYIATKLNLDLNVIEYMAEQLRIVFKASHPLTRLIDYEEWSKQSNNLRAQLKEDLLKQYERLSADIATIPKDTSEFRRQQNLRRDLVSTTAPPTGGRKR